MYNAKTMVVIRGVAQNAEQKNIKKVKHILSDVLTDSSTQNEEIFEAFGSRPKSIIRGVHTRPTTTISLGKVKHVFAKAPVMTFTKPDPTPVMPSLPPIDPSLYEDDVAAYRVQAQRQVDLELAAYKERVMATVDQEKAALLKKAQEEGILKAQKNAELEYQKQAKELFYAINAIQDQRYLIVEREQQDLIDLSIKIASAVVTREIEIDPSTIFDIVKKTLEKVTDTDKVIIKVNPASVDIVREHQDVFLTMMPDIRSLLIQGDERLTPGSCVIETKLGFVDASVTTKLETLRQAVLGVVGS